MKVNMKKLLSRPNAKTVLLSALIFSALTSHAQIEKEEAPPENKKWHYEFTPYLWLTSMDGTVGFDRIPGSGGITVNQSFSDILKRMDITGMASFDARHDKFGFFLDGIYLRLSDQGNLSSPNNLIGVSGRGKITQQMYAAAGYYRPLEGQTSLDLMAGLRYNAIKWDATFQLISPLLPDLSRRIEQRKSWVDPYLGVRVLHQLNPQWSLLGYADVGGAGIGSRLTWQAIAGANYAFRPNINGKFGYRHIFNDYKSDGFNYNMSNSGFYIGLGFDW